MFKNLSLKKLNKESLLQHKEEGNLDSWFLILVMALLTIGTVMMFSASYIYASYYDGDSFLYLRKQAIFVVLGLLIMFFVSKIKISFLKKFAPLLMLIAILLLIIVIPFSTELEGSDETFRRWLKIPFTNITFQPSDIAKVALILFLALVLTNNRKKLETEFWYALVPLSVIGVVCGLVLAENHLSGTILLAGIGLVMIYLGGAKKGWFYFFFIAGILVVVFFIINREYLPGYIEERLKGWLDEEYSPTGARWQTNQSLYAIGSGGLFGTGLGGSKQKHLYLPEPHNDFVFAIVCEELGYIRTVGIILLFVLLVWRGFKIGMQTKDRFSSLVVMGITFQVGLQTVLNIGVVTGMLPNTGISLPFFSYGGTALIMLLAEMGIVLSASRGIKKEI